MKSWKWIYLTDEPIKSSDTTFNCYSEFVLLSQSFYNGIWNPVSNILMFPIKSPTDAYFRLGLSDAPQQVIPKELKLNYFIFSFMIS